MKGWAVAGKSAVVIGGGFAGLTAGYRLSRAGWRVTLLEAGQEVGGRVRTLRRDGYTFDVGATQMASGYAEYLALCGELGMADQMVESSQHVGILRGGKVHAIDVRSLFSGATSPVLSLRSKLTLMKTVKDALAVRPPVDVLDVSRSHVVDVESAAAYARRRLNRELYDVLVDPLIRCYVMRGAEQVSALEWFSALKNLGGEKLLSLSGGNDRLPKALAAHMDVRLGARALGVDKRGAGVEVRFETDAGGETGLTADACVVATQLPEAMSLYAPARAIAGELGESLNYSRAWVAQLGYRRLPDTPVVGVLLPTVEHADIGLLWLEHNKNPDRAPAGHALFSVYSDEIANDRCFASGDEALIGKAQAFVEKLFPALRGHLDVTQLTRWPAAIANPAPGIYKKMAAMRARMDAGDTVQLAGDYLTCTGQNSAIHYGARAAANILSWQR